MDHILDVINKQRLATNLKNVDNRKSFLKKLRSKIETKFDKINQALSNDLGKCEFETYLTEVQVVLNEIDHAIKNISKWAKGKKVGTSLALFPVRSYIKPEPFGSVLLIAPWNYPFNLIVSPLIGAIAAGNNVIIKPSEMAPHTSKMIKDLVSSVFTEDNVAVIEGAVEETTFLLDQKFDYIFYTGSTHVGKIIMEKAAKHLTPVTLELGGKSPALVHTQQIDLAAKRIIWGKFLNAGQTCVAPDYILINKSDEEQFLSSCKKWLKHFFGDDIKASPDYGRIINEKHFQRLSSYLEEEGCDVLIGGERCDKYMAPTIVRCTDNHTLLKEEIFGPILPIVTIESFQEGIDYITARPKPLAAYAFLDRTSDFSQFENKVQAGGILFNDTVVHLSNKNLPFGGVGPSGMGAYHGKHSFNIFSHHKSIMKRSFWFENSLRYPPYKGKLALVKKIMSLIA